MSAISAKEAAKRSLQIQSWPGTPSMAGNASAPSAPLQPPLDCPVLGHSALPDQQARESDSSKQAAALGRGTEISAGTEDSKRMAGWGVSGTDSAKESSSVCAQAVPVLRLPPAENTSGIISVSRVSIPVHRCSHAFTLAGVPLADMYMDPWLMCC